MLIILLIVVFLAATIHFSHVLMALYLFSEKKLSTRVMLLRPLALCIIAACAQYYILSMISGYNLPVFSGLALVITNAFFFIGLHSAYRIKIKHMESGKHS